MNQRENQSVDLQKSQMNHRDGQGRKGPPLRRANLTNHTKPKQIKPSQTKTKQERNKPNKSTPATKSWLGVHLSEVSVLAWLRVQVGWLVACFVCLVHFVCFFFVCLLFLWLFCFFCLSEKKWHTYIYIYILYSIFMICCKILWQLESLGVDNYMCVCVFYCVYTDYGINTTMLGCALLAC